MAKAGKCGALGRCKSARSCGRRKWVDEAWAWLPRCLRTAGSDCDYLLWGCSGLRNRQGLSNPLCVHGKLGMIREDRACDRGRQWVTTDDAVRTRVM